MRLPLRAARGPASRRAALAAPVATLIAALTSALTSASTIAVPLTLAVTLAGAALPAVAQEKFPGKPIRIIVPQTAGGASDALSRIVAQEMGRLWGQQIVVDNRGGAGGTIGTDAVAKSAPDGYTWLMSYAGTHAINPALYKSLPYDTLKDLTPIASVATLPFLFVINPKVPAKNLAEFVAYAKSHPGAVNIASSGNGSTAHLAGEMLNSAAGIKMTHVPYKGAAGALTDLIGGQVQAFVASAPSVLQHVRSGAVVALASASTRRNEAFKDVPTFAEAGYPQLAIDSWFALFVPSATPGPLVRQIHNDINKVLAEKDVAARLAAQGADPMVTSLEAFDKVVREDMDKWGRAVRESGAKID
jgi:tripartite-type tricarboxylate transporter receptor subunit TctC